MSSPRGLEGGVLAVLGLAVVPIEQGAGNQEADEGSCRAIQQALSLTALWMTAYPK